MSRLITIPSKMTDFSAWNKFKPSINHAKTSTENRNEAELLAGNHLNRCLFDRSLNFDRFCRKSTKGFIALPDGNFLN